MCQSWTVLLKAVVSETDSHCFLAGSEVLPDSITLLNKWGLFVNDQLFIPAGAFFLLEGSTTDQ